MIPGELWATGWSKRKVSKIFTYISKIIWATKIYHTFLSPWELDIYAGVSSLHIFTYFVSLIDQVSFSDYFQKPSSFKVQQFSQIVNDFFSLVPARNKFTSLCTVKVASKNCLSGLQFLELWLVSYHSGNLQSRPSKAHYAFDPKIKE